MQTVSNSKVMRPNSVPDWLDTDVGSLEGKTGARRDFSHHKNERWPTEEGKVAYLKPGI